MITSVSGGVFVVDDKAVVSGDVFLCTILSPKEEVMKKNLVITSYSIHYTKLYEQ